MKLEELLSEYARLPEYIGFDAQGVSVSTHSTFGNFPINIASARGRVDEVKLLLENGSDINQIGEHGYTPLHEAVEQGCVEVAKLLLARGADTKIKNDDGETPLELPLLTKEGQMADLLRQYESH